MSAILNCHGMDLNMNIKITEMQCSIIHHRFDGFTNETLGNLLLNLSPCQKTEVLVSYLKSDHPVICRAVLRIPPATPFLSTWGPRGHFSISQYRDTLDLYYIHTWVISWTLAAFNLNSVVNWILYIIILIVKVFPHLKHIS